MKAKLIAALGSFVCMRSEFFFLLGEEKNAKKAIGMLHGEILLPAAKVFRHMISSMLTTPFH